MASYGHYDYGGWAPYVTVAERRKQAERTLRELRKAGHALNPVTVQGRSIAKSFWGKAWCDNLESYRDYENRLPRGRSYVRNAAVLDLQIEALEIRALVCGSALYKVGVRIESLRPALWQAVCADCAGRVDSLVALLQGRFSKDMMEHICRQDRGLFPKPSEIRFSCTCPDGAMLCKHVAAVLYGVGARLDEKPELLFTLRAVDANDLIANLDKALPIAGQAVDTARVLDTDDISMLFGLDMADTEPAIAAGPASAGSAITEASSAAKPVSAPAKRTPAPRSAGKRAKAPSVEKSAQAVKQAPTAGERATRAKTAKKAPRTGRSRSASKS